MGLHHKLCHTLGGSFNLPHADVHTVILPHALALQPRHRRPKRWRASRVLWAATTRPEACSNSRRGAATSLKAIGMPAEGLDRAADLAVTTPYPNPRPLERAALRALLQRAFDGAAPQG